MRGYSLSEIDIEHIMRQDFTAICTDGDTVAFGEGVPHARFYGTMPRKIRRYVMDRGVITLPFAIRSMTSLPAQIMGLTDRGWIRMGYWADLVMFDESIEDAATFTAPHQYPWGTHSCSSTASPWLTWEADESAAREGGVAGQHGSGSLRRLDMRPTALLSCRILLAASLTACMAPEVCAHQTASSPPAPTMASTIDQWWTMISRQFVAAAEAMPAEKYSFAPKDGAFEKVRTFGEQVKHVACANYGFFNQIEGKTPPPNCGSGGPDPAKTKEELMQYLKGSFDYAQDVLRRLTPANAMDPISGPYGGSSTRLGITTLAVWHASDHYGQLVVYLRMNGIVPPASRGPAH
jgi:uncharacterized damage-inducible protein DinB